jgi:hypothetical protein
MADEAPPFDPTKPFTEGEEAPPFDPNQPFTAVPEPEEEFGTLPPAVVLRAKQYADDESAAFVAKHSHGTTLKAFGQGFREGVGEDRFGLSDESIAYLQDKGLFRQPGETMGNPFKAFNETIALGAAATLDAANRGFQGVFRGAQAAVVQAGLPRDIAAMPEAFMGSPHPLAVPKGGDFVVKSMPMSAAIKPWVRQVPVDLPEGSPAPPSIPRNIAARTSDPLVNATLDHPQLDGAINNPVLDDSHEIGNSLGGSEPKENPTLYRDKDFPKTVEQNGVKLNTGEAGAVHENTEEYWIDAMMKGGMDREAALRVAFWGAGEVAEDALYRFHGMDAEKVEEKYTAYLNRIAARPSEQTTAEHGLPPPKSDATSFGAPDMALRRRIVDAYADVEGPHGKRAGQFNARVDLADLRQKLPNVPREQLDAELKRMHVDQNLGANLYHDDNHAMVTAEQHRASIQAFGNEKNILWISRDPRQTGGVPPDLFRETYPKGDATKAEPGPIEKPTDEEIERGRALVARQLQEDRNNTITLSEARSLGVIETDIPEPTFADSPSELAERAMPRSLSGAATPAEERVTPRGHKPGKYDKHGKEWIDKIDEPDDVRDVVEKIANDHDFFPEARGGVASVEARNAVAEAAGISAENIDAEHFSTHFDSDGKVRAVIQVLRQTAKDVAEAADKQVKEPTIENLAALTEAELRHAHALEYTLGLRAESGRTLNAWKDLLRETEHAKATGELRKQEVTGEIPQGTASFVDAAKDVQDNLNAVGKEAAEAEKATAQGKKPKEAKTKKLGLDKLISQASKLVDEARKPRPEKAPLSPELQGLVDEAGKVMKRFGAGEDVDLQNFRSELDKLAAGEGKLGDVVEAARALIEKEKKPEKPTPEGPPPPPAEKGRLMGAAKRLVAAADQLPPEVKAGASGKMQELMEAARQAVGRLKTQALYPELAEFRRALAEGDPAAARSAAIKLVESEETPAAGAPKPPVEHNVVMNAARRLAKIGEEEVKGKGKGELPPDIADLLEQTRKASGELKEVQESVLGKLIDRAEQQAIDMVKTRAVKEPAEALPPELQALVDKSKRVTKRFGGIERGEKAAMLLARTGRTLEEQEQLARSVQGLSPDQVARVLEKVRDQKQADRPGWFYWMWQQGLISGIVTHSKYLVVNTASIVMDRWAAPSLSATMGKVRGENVSILAPTWGMMSMIHQLPDAWNVAWQAAKTNMRIPLESEMRLFERGEESPQKGAGPGFTTAIKPEWGFWKNVFNENQLDKAALILGIPGRSANLIHTLFKVMTERASQAQIAYETAAKENPSADQFWHRYQYHLDNPTDDALTGAVNDAYNGAFMGKLGERTEQLAHALKTNPVGKWIFPFQHIPYNIVKRGVEYSPFAPANLMIDKSEIGAALRGEKGQPAQNLAVAKMVIGSSILGYFMHKFLADEATGGYPSDRKERNEWTLTGKQPNSIMIGDQWVSLERLGPAGLVAMLGIGIGEVARHYYRGDKDDAALSDAMAGAIKVAADVPGNEVGFQSLRNIFDLVSGKQTPARFVGYQLTSLMPYSSFLSQNASFIDPYLRKTNGIIDSMKYRIPLLRETVPARIDPLYGEPVHNPGYHNFLRKSPVNEDPARQELDRVGYYPTAPRKEIGGVKLSDNLYDTYQRTAGLLVKQALAYRINMEGWQELPDYVRYDLLRNDIATARKQARGTMQMSYSDQLLVDGVKAKRGRIRGAPPPMPLENAP